MTINPEVDIRLIITNISQKIGLLSITALLTPAASVVASVRAGGGRKPNAAMTPTTEKMIP